MTEEKLTEIKSHAQPYDRTCFDVRRAFEDRGALIAEVDNLRALLGEVLGGDWTNATYALELPSRLAESGWFSRARAALI